MQFFATAQPYLVQCAGPRAQTTMLTRAERMEFVDDLASGKLGLIPLCIDHAGADEKPASKPGEAPFVVPGDKMIGRVVHAVLRENGQLLITGEIFHERDEGRRIIADIQRGERWGVSLCTNLGIDRDMTTVHWKKVTHVGVTRSPEFGPEGTWIHLAATNWPAFYRTLAEDFVAKETNMYMAPALRAIVAPLLPRTPYATLQVAASRHTASEPTPRLAAGRVQSRPAPSSYSRPMDDSQAQTQSAVYDRDTVVREASQFLDSIFSKRKTDETGTVDPRALQQAESHRRNLSRYLEQQGIATKLDEWPSDVMDTMVSLRAFENESIKNTRDFVNEHYTDKDVREHANRSLMNPTLPDNLPYVAQIMSTHNKFLMNQREFDKTIRENNAAIKSKDDEILAQRTEVISLKRKHEDAEKELLQLRQKTAPVATTTTSNQQAPIGSAAAAANSTSVAAPDAKRARTDDIVQTDALASTASRTMSGAAGNSLIPPDLKNPRMIGQAKSNKYSFGANPLPIVDRFVSEGYLQNWNNDEMRERISRIANNR